MRSGNPRTLVISTLLLSSCLLCLINQTTAKAQVVPKAAESKQLLEAVQQHVDLFMEHGKDKYGDKKTELFIDGMHVDDYRPTIWRDRKNDRLISNFATQQVWLRTLVALSLVNGDPKYQQQAQASIRSAFANLQSRNGLLFWGGHLAYDLKKDEAWGMWNNGHEFKRHYPFYEGLYEVDSVNTKRLMQAVWLEHVHDWRTLLVNRHAAVIRPGRNGKAKTPAKQWNYPYDANPTLPLENKTGHLSFYGIGISMIYAGLEHARLTQEPELEKWAMRLLERYWAMRDADTHIGGMLFNVRYNKSAAKDQPVDKAEIQYGKLLGDRAREWLILEPLSGRQLSFTPTLLLAADQLPENSPIRKRLIDESIKEWVSYYKYAYDKNDRLWKAISIDGQRLPWQKMSGISGYYSQKYFDPKPTNGQTLWLAALAYRLSPSAETFEALSTLFEDAGLKGLKDKKQISVDSGFTLHHAETIYALIEVHRAELNSNALQAAVHISLEMLKSNRVNGLFVPSDQHIWASINQHTPLAILHLITHLENQDAKLPVPYPDAGYLHAPYHGIKSKNWGRTYDHWVFYKRTRSQPTVESDSSDGR